MNLVVMSKIQVKIVLLEDGPFLLQPKTNYLYKYKSPHLLVGKMDMTTFRLIKL